jgi:CheY-like chemotaxis protein
MPTVLVVDDDRDTCRNMADVLGDCCGYRVDTAECGDIALEKAQRHKYDVALLDLLMPGMDGLTLCRHLKQLWPSLTAIVVTACPDHGLEEDADAAGVQRVLQKPVDFSKLLALVEQVLSATRSEEAA